MRSDPFPRIPRLSSILLEPCGPAIRVNVHRIGKHRELSPLRLRITVAEGRRGEFSIVGKVKRETVCRWDIRFPVRGQIFESWVSMDHGFDADSIELCMERGNDTLPVYSGDETVDGGLEFFQPHIPYEPEGSSSDAMAKRLASGAVLTEFNWMAGNVLDGIQGGIFPEQQAMEITRNYLGKYLDFDGVSRESPGSCPDFGVEDTAPFAALARIAPEHPWVLRVIDFWRSHQGKDGCVMELGRAVAEGSYTVAYPMAVIARMHGDKALAAQAVRQLIIRRDELVTSEGIWLRAAHPGSPRSFLNWARGVAWYFLGLCATVAELQAGGFSIDGLHQEVTRSAEWVCRFQRSDGLWGGFLHEPATREDTSGSAGIAAGLAIAMRSGMVGGTYRTNLSNALAGLERNLTPDGFLGGSTQRNTAGEFFQRSDYRILAPYAAGLYALALGNA